MATLSGSDAGGKRMVPSRRRRGPAGREMGPAKASATVPPRGREHGHSERAACERVRGGGRVARTLGTYP